jgi:hypothetical protein
MTASSSYGAFAFSPEETHSVSHNLPRTRAGFFFFGLIEAAASRPPFPRAIHPMSPPARECARQGPALRRDLDASVAEPPPVAPRLLVHVGLRLRGLAPLAERMQVALAVGAAVDPATDITLPFQA